MFLFCLVFAMSLYAFAMSLCTFIYMCFVVTCWERADLLALVCGVCCECHFPIDILVHVWYLIVSIPDLCTLTYFNATFTNTIFRKENFSKNVHSCRLSLFKIRHSSIF